VEKRAFITVKEYAAYRGVHPSTVIRWITDGRVPAEQPAGKKGRFAIPAEMIVSNSTYAPLPDWPERPL
jgi:excisionase family DNA binding protein